MRAPLVAFVATLTLFVASEASGAPTPRAPTDADSASVTQTTTAPPEADRPATHDKEDDGLGFALLGGVGFPRPLAVEGMMRFGSIAMAGFDYSMLPKTSIGAVNTRVWAASGDLRVFPFRNAFFLGLRGGYQSLSVDATLSATGIGSYTESVDIGTWFLNPRLGFLWKLDALAVGVDAGVQLPLTASVSHSSSLDNLGVSFDTGISQTATTLGKTPLPTVDLLRIGLVL